ncbi:UDP-N-acetylglucosamine 2-epimerase [Cobetia amphilecti]|uniref:UDP-N-acetylglucosamine 2-epimerase n=1 Tax=Cobetia amphilecti TaxID=1055104 RepID=UPI00254D7657|nr:UDP-N-acetylglucosamine 2-epimerase [Cobetia amphilecti]
MKKILFITGTRADFGKLKKLMRFVESSSMFELHVFGTGMHMMQRYGSTYREVEKENYKHTYFIPNQHVGEPMCSILGNTINIFSRLTNEISPDLIVIHGDRLEALAGATVGALQNRLVCHIEGGELSGTVDEVIRHSVSKLSNVHMVANQEAEKRLLQMGEIKDSIYIIGSPDLDVMKSDDLPTIDQAMSKYEIVNSEYSIVLFHPVTTEKDSFEHYTENFFEALKEVPGQYVIVYPNNDDGSEYIINAIENNSDNPKFSVFPSIRFEYFLVLLKNAKCIIGNSSAGIREAPFYGVPTVNVGSRQNNRSAGNTILNCDYDKNSIINAVIEAQNLDVTTPSFCFGDGDSLSKFKKAIESDNFWMTSKQKVFVDL